MVQFRKFLGKLRRSRKMLLFIVYLALLLDYMLLTTVVPILPDYLYRLDHPNGTLSVASNKSSSAKTDKPVAFRQHSNHSLNATVIAGMKDKSEKTVKDKATAYNKAKEAAYEPATQESIKVGLLLGADSFVQTITNLFLGPVINRLGFKIPMITGCVILGVSTLTFAFGKSYGLLLFARSVQGVGSACTNAAGLGMLSLAYPEDTERATAFGIALGGIAVGMMIGPPFGGALYQYAGKELPFIIIAVLALIDGALRLFLVPPKYEIPKQKRPSIISLIKDPYIAVTTGAITLACLGFGMLGPSLTVWMMDRMHASTALQGAAFLPNSVAYLVASNAFGPITHRIGRWLSAMIGLVVIGICLMTLPSATSFYGLIAPMALIGIAIGMVDVSMHTENACLADLRYNGAYGSVFAIAGAAFSLSFAFGPMISGPIVQGIGFPGLMYLLGSICIAYAPLLFFLRRVPGPTTEKKPLLHLGDTVLYNSNGWTKIQDQNDLR